MKAGICFVAFCCVAGFATGFTLGSWLNALSMAMSFPSIAISSYILLERWRERRK